MVPYQVVHTDYAFTVEHEPALRVLASQAMDFPFTGAYILNIRATEMDKVGLSYVESIAHYVRGNHRRFRVYFKPDHPYAAELRGLNIEPAPGIAVTSDGLIS